MSDTTRPPGKTTIAPSVLLTIARLTTLDIGGISRMCQIPGGVNRIFAPGSLSQRGSGEGVRIRIEDDRVYADLYVVLEHDVNVREVSRKIQNDVARAISEMVGMEVGRVNVHIEDIDYPPEAEV
ncbi:MAG: Asp23/Gls24 family envelope stress response protein [Chloroflexi bacterium]|nr:Asp23/Gls24 family envelope stress response protein [Chloroflexota bacterium]MBU1661508.1 Asp23/Gls24 family envelope stress response protein [Chloroflexota bacterium]